MAIFLNVTLIRHPWIYPWMFFRTYPKLCQINLYWNTVWNELLVSSVALLVWPVEGVLIIRDTLYYLLWKRRERKISPMPWKGKSSDRKKNIVMKKLKSEVRWCYPVDDFLKKRKSLKGTTNNLFWRPWQNTKINSENYKKLWKKIQIIHLSGR